MKTREKDLKSSFYEAESLTRPFNLAARLTAPRFRIDAVPFTDIGLIALLTLFLSQSVIFSPGVPVDLPTLPENEVLLGVRTEAVATIWKGNVVTVLGSYPLSRLGTALQDLKEESPDGNATLLLLVDQSTDLEALVEIYEEARIAGFEQIQMAARPADSSN
ncbi:MAG: biopolymer transporter ExbD [Verrucomicrobiota bacterium]